MAGTLLAAAHHSGTGKRPARFRRQGNFPFFISDLPKHQAPAGAAGTALAIQDSEQRLKLFKPNSTSRGSTHMKIENLTKDLDTEDMTDVRGGTALTAQVVPTNVQCNAAAQKFDVGSCAPVAIGNSADQSNYSSQSTFEPVGSVFVTPTWCAD